jgi:hypothetical protein
MIRCVWMALLFMADNRGFVHSSVPGLAAAAVVSLEEAEEALALFLAPDRYSRTEEHEGRKIEKTKGGWRLLNYSAYRETAKVELARESKREWYYRNKTRDPNLADSTLEKVWRSPSLSSSLSDPDPSLEEPEQEGILPEARGQRAVHRSLDGWEPRPELYARAVEIGLGRDVVDARIAELRNGPIGGRRGVFDRDDYVMRQLPTWKAWHETAQSQAVHKAGLTSGGGMGPRRGAASGPVLEPTGKHRAYAEKHGLPLAELVRELVESGAVESLGAKRALELLGQKMSKAVRMKGGSG